jgi:hypothetical protein
VMSIRELPYDRSGAKSAKRDGSRDEVHGMDFQTASEIPSRWQLVCVRDYRCQTVVGRYEGICQDDGNYPERDNGHYKAGPA